MILFGLQNGEPRVYSRQRADTKKTHSYQESFFVEKSSDEYGTWNTPNPDVLWYQWDWYRFVYRKQGVGRSGCWRKPYEYPVLFHGMWGHLWRLSLKKMVLSHLPVMEVIYRVFLCPNRNSPCMGNSPYIGCRRKYWMDGLGFLSEIGYPSNSSGFRGKHDRKKEPRHCYTSAIKRASWECPLLFVVRDWRFKNFALVFNGGEQDAMEHK